MSGAAEAAIFKKVFDLADAAVDASTHAAYKAARHLPDLYNEAMQEFRGRADSELHGLFEAKRAHDARIHQAIEAVTSTTNPSGFDSNAEFLKASLEKLRSQLDQSDDAYANFEAQFQTLENHLIAHPDDIATHWREFDRLQSAIATHRLERATQRSSEGQTSDVLRPDQQKRLQIEHLREEIAAITLQLEGPLWVKGEGAKARERLEGRLHTLQALLENDPTSAAQGLWLLQSALGRARDSLATMEEARRRNLEEKSARVRELTGAIVARAQALSNQEALPSARTAALDILERLPQVLAGDLGQNLAPLQALADEAEALFDHTQHTLYDTAFAGYIRAQVTEVLGELGYRVSQLDGEGTQQSLVAVVDGQTGVEIRIDGQGSLSSNLILFSDNETAAPVNLFAQERCCALLDEVYAGLRRRQLTVKEKKRKTLRSSDRVKTMPKSVLNREQAPHHEAQPAARTFD